MSSVGQSGVVSYESVVKNLYKGTGDTKEKEKNAKATEEATEKDDLPKTEESEWKEPICTVYECFNKWLEDDKAQAKEIIDNVKTKLKFSWYKAGSEISIWDFDKYKSELFDTTEAQEAYKKYLKGEAGVNGDPIGIKLQTGNIMADERAFRLRHNPISKSFACGIADKNNWEFVHFALKNKVAKIREMCDAYWKALHTDRSELPKS